MNNNNSNDSKGSKVILFMFWLSASAKIFHWQTTKYANHQAAGALFDSITKLTDNFVEKFIGVYGRPRFASGASVPVTDMSKDRMLQTIGLAKAFLSTTVQSYVTKDTELQNIRDEIIAELDQTLYLLTLN